jgi:hypothetical protein
VKVAKSKISVDTSDLIAILSFSFKKGKPVSVLSKVLCFIPIIFNLFLPMQKKSFKYLALGDSYTIGESVSEKDRWPNQLAEKLSIPKPRIIATTGWRTDDLKGAMDAANLATSMILFRY